MKIMMIKMKKWLYSVAFGALLVAGSALGVTTHEVLSENWWSEDTRATHEHLDEIAPHPNPNGKVKKDKTTTDANGDVRRTYVVVYKGPAVAGTRWKAKTSETRIDGDDFQSYDIYEKLTSKRQHGTYKEKSVQNDQWTASTYLLGDGEGSHLNTYTVKALKKDAKPIKGYVVGEPFRDSMLLRRNYQFDGTEEVAVTNIVSDREAYVTGTVRQSGYLNAFRGYEINKPASLLREYTKYITTDANHVYIDTTITETTQNEIMSNAQRYYKINYVATFKDGRWKTSKETVEHTYKYKTADWFFDYLKYKESLNSNTVSSAMATKEREPQSANDLNNVPNGPVRVVVSGKKPRLPSPSKNDAHEPE